MTLVIPTTPFERVAIRYIRHQHALGKHFVRQQWVIGRLARFLAQHAATDVDAALFEAWCQVRRSTSPTNRRSEALIIRKLCIGSGPSRAASCPIRCISRGARPPSPR
jgi:hypothetical protein